MILEFALSYFLITMNTYFKKRLIISFKSGNNHRDKLFSFKININQICAKIVKVNQGNA